MASACVVAVDGNNPGTERFRDHHRRQAHSSAPVNRHPLAGPHPAVGDHGSERRGEAAARTTPPRRTRPLSGSRTRLAWARGTATRCANEPGRVNPGCNWFGTDLGITGQRRIRSAHSPGRRVRSPGHPPASPIPPGPTATTVPANSCPGMIGKATGSCPRQACQSDRHTPVAATSTTTPSSGHSASSIVNHRGQHADLGIHHSTHSCDRRPTPARHQRCRLRMKPTVRAPSPVVPVSTSPPAGGPVRRRASPGRAPTDKPREQQGNSLPCRCSRRPPRSASGPARSRRAMPAHRPGCRRPPRPRGRTRRDRAGSARRAPTPARCRVVIDHIGPKRDDGLRDLRAQLRGIADVAVRKVPERHVVDPDDGGSTRRCSPSRRGPACSEAMPAIPDLAP